MPVIQWLEIRGFRAFTQMQRLDFSAQLALISGPNSHGKTSIVEAIEFLLCGETLRRTFLGGAKAEFEGTLRNAHMAADDPVSVKAGILGTDGIVHVVERILVKDYAAEGDCESELKVDGAPAEDISVTGIGLAEPPLRTPILFQHTVRFALSASPSERARYFRAILEIEDLEVVREEVARLRDELVVPASPELRRLDRLAAIEPLKATVMAIRSAETLEELEVALRAALAVAFDELDLDGLDAISSLGQQAALVSAKTDAHGEESFPSAEFIAGEVPGFELPGLGSVGEYEQAALGADRDVERLRKVFEATLELPHVASAEHPIDCPVCQTAAALSPDRLHQMRWELAAAGDFRRAQTRAREEVDQAIAELARIARLLTGVIPAAAMLTEDDYRRRSEQAGSLLSDGEAQLEGLTAPLNEFRKRVEAVRESAAEAGDMATAVRTQIIEAKAVDTVGLERGLDDVAEKLASVPSRRENYTVKAFPLLDELRAAAVERQQVAGWSELAELAGSPEALLDGLLKRRAHEKSARSLRAAYDDIEAGIGKVLDAKFRSMSSEIARWWKLLRPDEPVEFTKVDRRGSGRRFVLFKALLRPGSGLDGVERDALGVFSDSQLNALGLAAFLARTTKHGDRFVVLDDPVQAGDDEHRATFATGVVEELLGADVQVLVVSHEHQLSKLMHNRYDHLPIAGFAVSMAVPGDGAHVVATSDTAEALLQRAAATLSIEDPEYRKINAGKLRDAGERVAKEILVKKRTEAGETASIADYEGQTLGPLIAALEPYHKDASHRGKWNTVNTMLSPGAHDADPPAANELRIASGDLKRFHKDYLKD